MEELDLKDFYNYAKKYIVLILIAVIIGVVDICIYDLKIKKPLYKSSTTILLVQEGQQITNTDLTMNKNLVSTYSVLVKSELVLNKTIETLNLNVGYRELADSVKVTTNNDTEIIKVTVTSDNSYAAMIIANTIADIFTEEMNKRYKLNNISPFDVAVENQTPCNNTLLRDIVVVAMAIAVVGVGIVFLVYYFDDTVKYSEDIEDKIKLPVIAKITNSDIKTPKGQVKDELVIDSSPKSLVSENIKILKTNLQFLSVDKKCKTVLITSSTAGEGKSFVSSNLALAFAMSGKKVLLVDCDLRKGRLHHVFKLSNLRGLSNLLIDDVENYKEYITETRFKGLSILTRGKVPPNPSELLNSNKNKKLIGLLREDYNVVIFDGTPTAGLSDAIIMSTMVDEVLIVCRDSYTPQPMFENTRDSLAKVNADVAGVIFNGMNKGSKGYGYGYYNYTYKYYGDNNNDRRS